jgi:hypothetical protein
MHAGRLIDSRFFYVAHLSAGLNNGYWETNIVVGKLCLKKNLDNGQ